MYSASRRQIVQRQSYTLKLGRECKGQSNICVFTYAPTPTLGQDRRVILLDLDAHLHAHIQHMIELTR